MASLALSILKFKLLESERGRDTVSVEVIGTMKVMHSQDGECPGMLCLSR